MAWHTDIVYDCLSGITSGGGQSIIHPDCTSQTEWILFLLYIAILFLLLSLLMAGSLHGSINQFCKCCSREDDFRYLYLLMFTVYAWEQLSDILFVALVFIHIDRSGSTITNFADQFSILFIGALGCLSLTYLLMDIDLNLSAS